MRNRIRAAARRCGALSPRTLALLAVLGAAAGCARETGRSLAARSGLPYPALIAHRGASGLLPEETRAAFELARDVGADFLEADVQRTRDGVLVALHDESLERTTDVARRFAPRTDSLPGSVADYAVWKFDWSEIRELDAGTWFDRAHPGLAGAGHDGLHVLSLDELVDVAEASPHAAGLFLETKSALRYPGIERQMVELLERRGWIGDGRPPGLLAFESFVPASLDSLRRLAPGVPRFLLAERGSRPRDLLAAADKLGAGCAPHALDLLSWPGFAREAHGRGMLVYPWVLDEPWQMRLARAIGADGWFTNRANVAVRLYGSRPERMADGTR